MKKSLLSIVLFLFAFTAYAQVGEIQGKVKDMEMNGEGLPFANVYVEVDGIPRGTSTDMDGFYSIKPLPPGTYDVTVEFVGYATQKVTGIIVSSDKSTFVDFEMSEDALMLDVVEVIEYKVPLIDDDRGSGQTVTGKEIGKMPTRDVNSIAATAASVYQSDEGENLNVRGSRDDGTEYYVDGVKVRGNNAVPASGIEQLNVITGGVPARYGDATGGIVQITTRGATSTFQGGIEVITSQFLDPYGHNFVSGSLSGPILKIKKGDTKRTVMGFFLAGEFQTDKDDDPAALQLYKVKDDVRDEIIANPLRVNETGGFVQTIEDLDLSSLRKISARENTRSYRANFAGNFTISPTENIDIRIGGSVSYQAGGLSSQSEFQKNRYRRYEIFNDEHNRRVTDAAYRGYIRFTQHFGSRNQTDDQKENSSAFSNAFYSIQFDYSKSKFLVEDPIHRNNLFDYGHVGSFATRTEGVYNYGSIVTEDADGNPVDLFGLDGTKLDFQGVRYDGEADTEVWYEPGTANSIAAQQTSQYYDLAGGDLGLYNTLDAIVAGNGLINGERPFSLTSQYSMNYLPGVVYPFRFFTDNDQYRFTFNGSFDIKKRGASDRNKHAIEFGFEYEQRVDRYYEINAERIWNRVRAVTSKRGTAEDIQLDFTNPYFLINGEQISVYDYDEDVHGSFGINDTILYEYQRLDPDNQSYFDEQIRDKFGYGDADHIDFFALDPNDLSLDMFSPEDLFGTGGGDNIIRYHGYDHTGKRLNYQPAFEDFFKRDENGRLKGEIGAFRPIYGAAYIQDKFTFRDLVFNIGVRVDRFDANQKVRKDKYSLYGVRTVAETNEIGGVEVTHPESVPSDAVVYVDSDDNPSENIKGYRLGDQWYNALGEAVLDPDVVAQGGSVFPYLADYSASGTDIKNEQFDINTAFEDYTPQITVMPRVALSFKMSDEASFFAHYNVLSQRPQGRNFVNPSDYYYFDERAIIRTFNNANLRPEKTISYEIGFRQAISKSSAVTLSAFYKELRDMIQIVSVQYAYPKVYNTYDNIDFGTVKGFEIGYDMRRTKNLRLLANYTLQFAEGTGSGDRSGANLVNAGQPNLRTLIPLNFDARHTINVTVDYRFGEGNKYNGPKLKGKNLLENTGVNFILRARSGTPYTRQNIATPEQLIGVAGRSSLEGSINGSRLPANFRVDMKLDKDFKIGKGKNAKYLNLYVLIQNLLNTQNVTTVYSFTGSPVDDGFINSPDSGLTSQEEIWYDLKQQNPNNYTIPRRIRLGASFSF